MNQAIDMMHVYLQNIIFCGDWIKCATLKFELCLLNSLTIKKKLTHWLFAAHIQYEFRFKSPIEKKIHVFFSFLSKGHGLLRLFLEKQNSRFLEAIVNIYW